MPIKSHAARLLALTVALGAATLAVNAGANAQTVSGETPASVSVRFDDLDTTHAAGAAALMTRIKVAAGHVCGASPDIRDLSAVSVYGVCRRMAVEQAVSRLDGPTREAVADLSGAPMRLASR